MQLISLVQNINSSILNFQSEMTSRLDTLFAQFNIPTPKNPGLAPWSQISPQNTPKPTKTGRKGGKNKENMQVDKEKEVKNEGAKGEQVNKLITSLKSFVN